MIFVVLVVLIRRGNAKDVDWEEEDFEEPFEDEEQETAAPKEEDIQESAKDTETHKMQHNLDLNYLMNYVSS